LLFFEVCGAKNSKNITNTTVTATSSKDDDNYTYSYVKKKIRPGYLTVMALQKNIRLTNPCFKIKKINNFLNKIFWRNNFYGKAEI